MRIDQTLMKKAKIILILSLLIFITLLIVYITSKSKEDEANRPVSQRELYQKELQEKQDAEQ